MKKGEHMCVLEVAVALPLPHNYEVKYFVAQPMTVAGNSRASPGKISYVLPINSHRCQQYRIEFRVILRRSLIARKSTAGHNTCQTVADSRADRLCGVTNNASRMDHQFVDRTHVFLPPPGYPMHSNCGPPDSFPRFARTTAQVLLLLLHC